MTTEGPTPGGLRAPGLQANLEEDQWARGAWSTLQAGAGSEGRALCGPTFGGRVSPGLPGPSCDPTGPPTPTDVRATLIPSGTTVGAGTCPPAEAGGGGRWHVQSPLPLPSRRGRLPWERQADGGLVLPDHTLALPPRLPARAQPPSFLSEDRGSSQPSLLPPPPSPRQC